MSASVKISFGRQFPTRGGLYGLVSYLERYGVKTSVHINLEDGLQINFFGNLRIVFLGAGFEIEFFETGDRYLQIRSSGNGCP